jgi:IMP dehydrogenase
MIISEGLTFDDVLLVPQHSTVKSRSDVDLSIKFKKKGISTSFKHTIIPANMKTIVGYEMANAIFQSGGLGIIHRFMPVEEQIGILTKLDSILGRTIWVHLGLSVGVKDNDKKLVEQFVRAGAEILCIDVAHGSSDQCIKMTEWISQNYPEVLLISGNVATGSGARCLWEAGADIVKVGVGPGSLCTTRIETGNGVPQLTALMDVAKMREQLTTLQWHVANGDISDPKWHVANGDISDPNMTWKRNLKASIERPIHIIADGGIKNAGDVVKSLCFADMVMAGNLFAGCTETPGKARTIDGVCYKEYVGSSTHKTSHVEGIAALVHCKGTYESVLTKLLEGLRSGCSYQGANSLAELKDNPTFIKITNAGLKESHPHDVQIIK